MKHHERRDAKTAQEYSTSNNKTTERAYPTIAPTHHQWTQGKSNRRAGQPLMQHEKWRVTKNAQGHCTSKDNTTDRVYPTPVHAYNRRDQGYPTVEQCCQ